jgi:Disaggregatase related repeat/Dockerin type I domain
LPDNRYYDLDVTELVQGYVNGRYNNTGFFLEAKDENDNYIAFYSSEWSNASQRPKLVINSNASYAIEDVNRDGRINQTDLDLIKNNLTTNTPCQRCDVNTNGIVDIYDVTRVSVKV